MRLFGKVQGTPEAVTEYNDARKAFDNDPVNTGKCGRVDENSPEAQRNFDVQARLIAAEKNVDLPWWRR